MGLVLISNACCKGPIKHRKGQKVKSTCIEYELLKAGVGEYYLSVVPRLETTLHVCYGPKKEFISMIK